MSDNVSDMRLRWPLAYWRCDDCDARHWFVQKPWYVRRKGPLSIYVDNNIEWPAASIFSKDSIVMIDNNTELSRKLAADDGVLIHYQQVEAIDINDPRRFV